MYRKKQALECHEQWQGKLDVVAKSKVDSKEALSIAYTPGVAEPCREIHKNPEKAYTYTMKANTVAVISDGTAVLGLGDIGPEAAMPVMEGKAVLFKEFAGVNAIPLCLGTKDTEEIIKTVKYLEPTFGGINLEDIAAPRCFEIEARLKEELSIPVFHDDQHGTAIVVLAGIINALKIVQKERKTAKVVINGAGSAGIAIAKLLLEANFNNICLCDRQGILRQGMDINQAQEELLTKIPVQNETGDLSKALEGADIFIGVSAGGIVSREMVEKMNEDSIVFAMANPTPEIMPDEAKAGGVRIMGTGRSDFPNQVNNVLAFPGIFKGALQARTQITEDMKLAAAQAIADQVESSELDEEHILPEPFKPGIADAVAKAIVEVAGQ